MIHAYAFCKYVGVLSISVTYICTGSDGGSSDSDGSSIGVIVGGVIGGIVAVVVIVILIIVVCYFVINKGNKGKAYGRHTYVVNKF